jgi:hypothetical protein
MRQRSHVLIMLLCIALLNISLPRAELAHAAPFSATTIAGRVLELQPGTPPNNDNFAAATPVSTLPSSLQANTTAATTEPGEPIVLNCAGTSTLIRNTVWYRFTPTITGSVSIDTFGSNFDTVLAVYTGSSLANLNQVACNNDTTQPGTSNVRQSRVSLTVTAGTTYHVQMGGVPPGGLEEGFGNLVVNFRSAPPPPANDNFAAAIPVSTLPTSFPPIDTTSATTEPGEPTALFLCGSQSIGNTVWYTFTPVVATTLTVDTAGSTFDTIVAVYTGNPVSSLTVVACNDDPPDGGSQARLSFLAGAGTTYRVQVGGFLGAFGNLVVNFTGMPVPSTATPTSSVTPTATPTATPTSTATTTPTSAATGTPTATLTSTRPATPTLTPAPSATVTVTSPTLAQALSQVQPSGQPGVPCASSVGQTCSVAGSVQGLGSVTASMSWSLTATVPRGVAAGTVPVAVVPTTAGLQGFLCSAVAADAGTVACAGTTSGNALQGSVLTVVFAPGVVAVGTVTGPGPAVPAGAAPLGGAAVSLLLPPPPPILLPPPPPPLVPVAPVAGQAAAPTLPQVPVIPESDTALLLLGGLTALAAIRWWRSRS